MRGAFVCCAVVRGAVSGGRGVTSTDRGGREGKYACLCFCRGQSPDEALTLVEELQLERPEGGGGGLSVMVACL